MNDIELAIADIPSSIWVELMNPNLTPEQQLLKSWAVKGSKENATMHYPESAVADLITSLTNYLLVV